MDKTFNAANGLQVRRAESGGVEVGKPGYLDYTTPAATFALEEFLQAEHDEKLGRWRWPENPDYVVYPFTDGSGCTALSEATGVSSTYLSRAAAEDSPSYLAPAALAYFEAHPERKPWEDAKPGEFWSVCHADTVEMCRVDDMDGHARFTGVGPDDMHVSMPVTHPSITHAVRFVAEDAS